MDTHKTMIILSPVDNSYTPYFSKVPELVYSYFEVTQD